MSTVDEALKWYDMGVTPIPCRFRSKQPVIKWGMWRDTLPPLPLVKDWFCGLFNIAILVPRNLLILDFDIPGYYHRWRANKPSIAKTYTVKSRRGYHVYLRVGIPVTTAAMEGGDIIGMGHLNTVPYSVHEVGHTYIPSNDYSILQIDSLADTGITPIERESVSQILTDGQGETTNRVWLPTADDDWQANKAIDRIKSNIDMFAMLSRLGVSLPGQQKSIVMRCPFHEDRNPSFQVWPDGAYCHSTSCRAHRGLDVIDLAALWWGVSAKTAVGMLIQMVA